MDVTREVPVAGAPRSWRLRFVFRDKHRIRILKLGERLLVGSSSDVDLCLDDPTVSGHHCVLEVVDGGLRVTDLHSKNGVYLGAGRVEKALLSGPSACFALGATSVEAEDRARLPHATAPGSLLGESDAMARVRASIERFAKLRGPVLIIGESGTGKDIVARALHDASGRDGRYLPLNVAALPDGLLDAELFGHVKGAFTGAIASRSGLFELASGGTLFLDEIADMSPSGQAKLLRVVEDGKVRGLGADREKMVDTRLVSATCVPLDARMESGEFREDLYHRLSMLVIELPALRNRRADIPLLAQHFLERIAPEVGYKHLLPATLECLRLAPWPGNVRQLFGVLYRAAALAPDDALAPAHLLLGSGIQKARARLDAERAGALLAEHGNISAAARAAGVPRTTFRSVLERQRLRALP